MVNWIQSWFGERRQRTIVGEYFANGLYSKYTINDQMLTDIDGQMDLGVLVHCLLKVPI